MLVGNMMPWYGKYNFYLQCGRDYLTLSSYICVVLLCYIINVNVS